MSARNRKYKPDPHGRCYTPPALAELIVGGLCPSGSVIEPSAGEGVFCLALEDAGIQNVFAVEPYSDCLVPHVKSRLEDALEDTSEHWDWAIGNPPYVLAESHVKLLLPRCRNIGFLLRINWAISRKEWLETTPLKRVIAVTPRPSFDRWVLDPESGTEVFLTGGNDATEYALFVWEENHKGPAMFEFLRWR